MTNNKKILIRSGGGHQYSPLRTESRTVINIGFGLGELGYDVNITCFSKLDVKLDNGNIVHLSETPIYNEYDYLLCWPEPRYIEEARKCKKLVFVAHWNNFAESSKHFPGMSIKYVSIYKNRWENLKRGGELEYLPVPYPIPCYHKGFMNYDLNLINLNNNSDNDNNNNNNNKLLKVYVFVSSRNNEHYQRCITEYGIILKRMIEIMCKRENGYKLKLYIAIDSIDNAGSPCTANTPIIKDLVSNLVNYANINYSGNNENKLEIEYINGWFPMDYDKYLYTLKSMDIVIEKGMEFLSRNYFDILSLGKPMIFVTFGSGDGGGFISPTYNHKDEIIYEGEIPNSIISKVDKFLANPKRTFDLYRESMKECDLENWKSYALKVFN